VVRRTPAGHAKRFSLRRGWRTHNGYPEGIAITTSTFRRARTRAEKQQRRDVILSAARELGLRHGVRNVTLGDVASEVGMAKSSVLRYFETREEVYLQITADGWRDWTEAARARLARAAPGAGEVADALTQTLVEMPLFCDLLAHTTANLEHNVSPRAARALKVTAWAAIGKLSTSIVARVPGLGEVAAADIVVVTSMLAGSVWQRANPPIAVAAAYRHNPDLSASSLEFAPSMRELLRTLIEWAVSTGRGDEHLLAYVPPTISARAVHHLKMRSRI
jgi:AcrR family transcriptional regulator